MNYLRHIMLTYNKKTTNISKPYWFAYFIKFGNNPFNVKVETHHGIEHFTNTKTLLKFSTINEDFEEKYGNTTKSVLSFQNKSNNYHPNLEYPNLIDEEKSNIKNFYRYFKINDDEENEENKEEVKSYYYFFTENEENKEEVTSDNYFFTKEFTHFLKSKKLSSKLDLEYNKYLMFKKENKRYTPPKNYISLVNNINIYYLRKERLYTKLKYSRVPSFDIVSGGFAAFLAAFFGFLILEKFGYELPDSGDFWYLVMYLAFVRFIYKAIAFGWNKKNNIFYLFSLKSIFNYLFNLYHIVVNYILELRRKKY
uniref:Uncharacterized protein n=1 Tax=Strombidium sp. TaxID=181122 RepID=A0A7T0M4P9_9SPIT|nr:hypothetical protein [Strombidium sp.]